MTAELSGLTEDSTVIAVTIRNPERDLSITAAVGTPHDDVDDFVTIELWVEDHWSDGDWEPYTNVQGVHDIFDYLTKNDLSRSYSWPDTDRDDDSLVIVRAGIRGISIEWQSANEQEHFDLHAIARKFGFEITWEAL